MVLGGSLPLVAVFETSGLNIRRCPLIATVGNPWTFDPSESPVLDLLHGRRV